MGNYMNSGSKNQQSYGFELNYLTKLSHTRSIDQKTTLLHFLADTVEKRHPEVIDFALDLRNVEAASRGEYMCVPTPQSVLVAIRFTSPPSSIPDPCLLSRSSSFPSLVQLVCDPPLCPLFSLYFTTSSWILSYPNPLHSSFFHPFFSLSSTVVSEELVLKQMKQMELSLGKLESELQYHKKPEQGDKFYDKMKVR